MTTLRTKFSGWLRAIANAYARITSMVHPHKPSPPPKAEPLQQPATPEDQTPIPPMQKTRKADEPPEKRKQSVQPAPAQQTPSPSGPADEASVEALLAEMENSEPTIGNVNELIRQNKLLARLKEELMAEKNDARAAERLARINENLARAARFQEQMKSYIQANQARAMQRKAEIENELLGNEEKIRLLAEERARLISARSQQDIARLEAIEKDILNTSAINERLIDEKNMFAETLAGSAAKKHADSPEQPPKMEHAVAQDTRHPAQKTAPLVENEMVHISQLDLIKAEAQEQARRNAERHKQIIEEQRARAHERAEQEAAMMRKRMAEIAAQREANLRARMRREGDNQPPQQ